VLSSGGSTELTRPLSVGNGNLLVNFDSDLVMRDFYYPFVGMMNHIEGRRNMMGFWVDGRFSWLDEPGWVKDPGYLEDALVTLSTANHEGLGLSLVINDAVHYRSDVYLKHVAIRNDLLRARRVSIFFANDFNIDESDIGDTALFDPELRAVYHYKRTRCFIIDGRAGPGAGDGGTGGSGIAQFSTGRKRFAGAEGTWRDAEDGRLEGHPISQGSVDSAISFDLELGPGEEDILYFWIAAGSSFDSARAAHGHVLRSGPERFFIETASFWRHWVARSQEWGGDRPGGRLDCLPPDLARFFRRSLLVVRSQTDNRGGILAANDTDILRHNRDHYSYVWARDGAMAAHALDLAGYHALTRRFFRFCREAISPAGFLWHKYHPDGSVGSSGHPWVRKDEYTLPLQEDETATVLWALGRHYALDHDLEFIDTVYDALVEPAAEFLCAYRDPATGLPRPSYDLWEERQGVFTYTAASVYGGLVASATLGDLFGHKSTQRWREAAEEVRTALLRHLYDQTLGRFIRGLQVGPAGGLLPDPTLDASLYGVALFGVLPAGDERVVRTMRQVRDQLWVQTEVGGVARYTDDPYFRKSDDVERVPGNPWVVCSLWLARWYIEIAETAEELAVALAILEWTRTHAVPGGHLPEQFHPYTGRPVSVAPLTWSHAEVVSAVLEYVGAVDRLGLTIRLPDGKGVPPGPGPGPGPGPVPGPSPGPDGTDR
jgi:GH15 family glucan-1,4-alpha-glucosidase